jgi:hypothetical protein
MKRFLETFKLFIIVCVVASGVHALRAQVPAPAISGVVYSNQRGPVGGVTVSLVHPVIGRSVPVLSAPNGSYFFVNVPPRGEPFFIEAYWGQQLLFRGQLYYQGMPIQFNIPLP